MSELTKCEVCGKEFKNLAVHMRKHDGAVLKVGKEGKPTPAPAPKDPMSAVNEKLDAVIGGLNSVSGALVKLVELQTSPKSEDKPSVQENKNRFVPAIEDETYPTKFIPPKFRKIIDEVLSPDFEINVQDFEDRTDFLFEIVVPDKYSSISKDDRMKGIKDVRSRMIARALGENGVRDWAKLVRQNLSKYYTQEGVASPFTNSIE